MATRYTITTERLHIRRGILSKHVQQTRSTACRTSTRARRSFDRLLRVGAVDFDTAGTDDSDFTFRGVANPAGVVAAVDRAQRIERAVAAERTDQQPL